MKTKGDNIKIDWSRLFDLYAHELPLQYVRERIQQNYEDNALFYHERNAKKESPRQYISSVKQTFLKLFFDDNIYQAFSNLQKRGPIITELLLEYCFDNNVLELELFSKIFGRIYTYQNKYFSVISTKISYSKILKMIKYCDKDVIMSKADRDELNNFPDEVLVYRGSAGKTNEHTLEGISWTLEKSKAEEFARENMRYFDTLTSVIAIGKISKENILLYINESDSGRYEKEVVVAPENIYDTNCINYSQKIINCINEFCDKGKLEEYREVLVQIVKKIYFSDCQISARYDSEQSLHEFNENNCLIRISLSEKYNNPREILWTILHELGHHFSGCIDVTERDNPDFVLKREVEAWSVAEDLLTEFSLLSNYRNEFLNYKNDCLKSYKRIVK